MNSLDSRAKQIEDVAEQVESLARRLEQLQAGGNTVWVKHSLTKEMVPFETKCPGIVTWYACGPTVYAPSHMGHARAYVSFDIIRRILSDYFGFCVTYAMNITDIDDKIIRGARQNYLFEKYESEVTKEQILSDARTALGVLVNRQKEQLETARRNLAECEEKSRNVTDSFEATVRGEEVKLRKLTDLEEFLDGDSYSRRTLNRSGLLKMMRSQFAEWLDIRDGTGIDLDTNVVDQHAKEFEALFFKDMRALGVRDPDVLTRVSEYVGKIIECVSVIIEKGYGYVADGSVYFDVDAYRTNHVYPKLKPESMDEKTLLDEGEGDMTEMHGKRSQRDFALWKRSKPGEPVWNSPWGPGRPGWHIECTAMASSVFGDHLDIHSGGIDLQFPHHDNEIAQSCAYFSQPGSYLQEWVGNWLHAGHLHIEGTKMSKSLKNFMTIQEALESSSGRQIRILFLMYRWERQIDFSRRSLAQAKAKERDLIELYQLSARMERQNRFARIPGKPLTEAETRFHAAILEHATAVDAALRRNFNYASAFEHVMHLVSIANEHVRENPHPLLVRKAISFIGRILNVFGIELSEYRRPVKAERILNLVSQLRSVVTTAANRQDGTTLERIQQLAAEYQAPIEEYHCASDFENVVRDLGLSFFEAVAAHSPDLHVAVVNEDADAFRRALEHHDVRLEDIGGGLIDWKLYETGFLKRQKMDVVRERISVCEQRYAELAEHNIPRRRFFLESRKFMRNGYDDIDDEGLPRTKNGQTLSDSARRKLMKILQKHVQKQHEMEFEWARLDDEKRFYEKALLLLRDDRAPEGFRSLSHFKYGTSDEAFGRETLSNGEILSVMVSRRQKPAALDRFLAKYFSSGEFIRRDGSTLYGTVSNSNRDIVCGGYAVGSVLRMIATAKKARGKGLALMCVNTLVDILMHENATLIGFEPIPTTVHFWTSHFLLREATEEEVNALWGAEYVAECAAREHELIALVLTKQAWKKSKKIW